MAHSSPSPPTQAYQSLFSRGLFGFLDKDTEASESWIKPRDRSAAGAGFLSQPRKAMPQCLSADMALHVNDTCQKKNLSLHPEQTHRASAVKRGFLGRRPMPLGSGWRGDPGPLPEANPTSTQRKRMGKAPSCLKTKREGRNLR